MGQPVTNDDVTVFSDDRAEEFVTQLGLDLQLISDALRDGDVGSREACNDPSFPPTAAGYFRWAITVASLRRSHVSSGKWELLDEQNRALIKACGADRTVTACGGTADVGDPNGFPDVAHRKGRATEEAYAQMELMTLSQVLKIPRDDKSTPLDGHWLLLYYRSKDTLKAELSLPAGIEDGKVTGWRVRVILPSHLFNDGLEELPSRNGEDDVDFYLEEA